MHRIRMQLYSADSAYWLFMDVFCASFLRQKKTPGTKLYLVFLKYIPPCRITQHIKPAYSAGGYQPESFILPSSRDEEVCSPQSEQNSLSKSVGLYELYRTYKAEITFFSFQLELYHKRTGLSTRFFMNYSSFSASSSSSNSSMILSRNI